MKIEGVIGWDTTSAEFKNQLSKQKGDIAIALNSGGGSIYEGIEIHNAIKAYDGKVDIKVGALCASMGTYVAMAGDSVEVQDNSTFMIHNGWTFAMGDHNALRKEADNLEALSNILAKAYVKKTGKKEDEVKASMDTETFYYGQEIVDEGFANILIDVDVDEDSQDKTVGFALARESLKNCQAVYREKLYSKDQESLGQFLATMPSVTEKIATTDGGLTAEQMAVLSEKISTLQAKIG